MLRDELLAARDGGRILTLQQSVALDPTLQDAASGLGLYHYYAAIAPAAPAYPLSPAVAGRRSRGGLREIQQTQSRSLLLRGEADYRLHLIYLSQSATDDRVEAGGRTACRYRTTRSFS
jgi:hypothetical protein